MRGVYRDRSYNDQSICYIHVKFSENKRICILKRVLSFVTKKLIRSSLEGRENKMTGDALFMTLSIPTSQSRVRKIKQNCD